MRAELPYHVAFVGDHPTAAVDRQKQSSEKQKKASKQETKRGDKRYEVAISNFTICWKLEYPISFSLDMSSLHIAT